MLNKLALQQTAQSRAEEHVPEVIRDMEAYITEWASYGHTSIRYQDHRLAIQHVFNAVVNHLQACGLNSLSSAYHPHYSEYTSHIIVHLDDNY